MNRRCESYWNLEISDLRSSRFDIGLPDLKILIFQVTVFMYRPLMFLIFSCLLELFSRKNDKHDSEGLGIPSRGRGSSLRPSRAETGRQDLKISMFWIFDTRFLTVFIRRQLNYEFSVFY